MSPATFEGRMFGSLFMAGLPGSTLDPSTLELIHEYGVGNFIIFRRNVVSPAQLATLCLELRGECRKAGLPPPLIAIDQEGGTVARLGPPFTQFPDARVLAEGKDAETALGLYAKACVHELLRCGININLSPVLDVSPKGKNLFMERRSLGGDPERVATLGTLIIETMQEGGLAACAKHFPGLGGAVLDPHKDLPVIDRSVGELEDDLVPFRAAIKAGVAAVMTSHTIYPALDPAHPATLSPVILEGLLRDRLGYQGVVATDDLEMGAIEGRMTVARAALMSVRAGADLLLICHDHEKVKEALETFAREPWKEEERIRLAASRDRINRLQVRFAVADEEIALAGEKQGR